MRLSFFWLLISQLACCFLCELLITQVKAAKCACTACPSGFCNSEWCLVGFKESRARLTQACGNMLHAAGLQNCSQNAHDWLEVCSCNENLCNSYKTFRTKVDSKPKMGSRQFDKDPMGLGGYDPPPGKDSTTMPGTAFSNANLVILLVCVPLGIGALAVVFVFVNYHCKLC